MELKGYQARVLADLDGTPNLAQAFTEHGVGKGVRVGSVGGQAGWNRTRTPCGGAAYLRRGTAT